MKNLENSNKLSNFIQTIKTTNMATDYQKNQESIVRQSSLKFTADYLKLIGTPLPLKEVIGVTNVIADYCANGYSKELGERLDKIDQHIQSKFEEAQ